MEGLNQSELASIRSVKKIESNIQNLKDFHLKSMQQYNRAMRDEYKAFKTRYTKFSENYSKLLKTAEALGVQLNAANDQNDALKRVNRSTVRENQELTMKCNLLEQTIAKLQKQADIFRDSLSSEHEQNEKLTNKLSVLQAQNEEQEAVRNEQCRIVGELRQKVSEQDMKCQLLNDKLKTLNKDNSERQQIYDAQIQLLVNKLNETDGQKYEHLHKDIQSLQKQNNDDALTNIQLQAQIEQHRSKMKQLETERDFAKSQVSSLLLRIEDIQNKKSSTDSVESSKRRSSILKKSVHFDLH